MRFAEAGPRLAIVIDDLGNDLNIASKVFELPKNVSVAILPKLQHSKQIAIQSYLQGRESLMHQPMESIYKYKLGPGGLTNEQSYDEMIKAINDNLSSVPHVSGVNNHMGSLLTQDPKKMNWLMKILKEKNLFFIDSRTIVDTHAENMARQLNLLTARRDVFLDNNPEPDAIRGQLLKAIYHAKKNGSAIAIGHPYPSTLTVLKSFLPKLKEQGVELISVSQVIRYQRKQRLWNQFSYHCLKVARNLKLLPLLTFCEGRI